MKQKIWEIMIAKKKCLCYFNPETPFQICQLFIVKKVISFIFWLAKYIKFELSPHLSQCQHKHGKDQTARNLQQNPIFLALQRHN